MRLTFSRGTLRGQPYLVNPHHVASLHPAIVDSGNGLQVAGAEVVLVGDHSMDGVFVTQPVEEVEREWVAALGK